MEDTLCLWFGQKNCMLVSWPLDGSSKTVFDDSRFLVCRFKKKFFFCLFGNSICVCLSEKDKEISEADDKGKEERALVVQFFYKKREIELLFCTHKPALSPSENMSHNCSPIFNSCASPTKGRSLQVNRYYSPFPHTYTWKRCLFCFSFTGKDNPILVYNFIRYRHFSAVKR